MPVSPSSSAQAARQRLAVQLREMRTAARLTGREFARRAGWADATNVSKIEKGQRTITADHVRLWCRVCGAGDQLGEELLAEQANVAGMWLTYAQLNRGGLRKAQESVRELFENVKLMRVYQTRVIPGLLQTRSYTTAALRMARLKQGVAVDDVEDAVDERMDRQSVLARPDARWQFIVEEDVLWHRPWDIDVHAEQLRDLLIMMRRPTVSFGIVPTLAHRRGVLPTESFTMYDTSLVQVELVSGFVSITAPDEVRMYLQAWDRVSPLAVHGRSAAALIRSALDDVSQAP